MLSYAEIQRSVQGAWLLAKGDTRGMNLFDLSVEGFWRSFAAMLIVAPVYALVLLAQPVPADSEPESLTGTLLAEAIAYVVGWAAFPIAAVFLTRLLGLAAGYVPLVVANNWSAVVQIAFYAAVVVLGTLLPGELRALTLLAATLAILVYQWFVIRTALDTGGGIALGIVVVDVLLSLAVSRGMDGLLGVG
ncbi:MAG TPA: hypothetical protein VFY87_13325 [Geminicoccaceae bacterium]|nr:hypothetical protein [Geminicoccaceae bacterium]